MEREPGAWCDGPAACFRYPDQDQDLIEVRLESRTLGDHHFAYDPATRAWTLRVGLPEADRFEYRLGITRRGGRRESFADPANPLRTPHGDAELRRPGYREPAWLAGPKVGGSWRDVELPLLTRHSARVWTPDGGADRVLVAHDGPDYERFAGLSGYAAATIGAGVVRPFHVVLLPAGERLEWYSAFPAYARNLVLEVLPKLAAELGGGGPPVGIGASLGALAMLHAQWTRPGSFGGLFLQSGSFFQPRFDRQESGFARWLPIVRFTGRVLRGVPGPPGTGKRGPHGPRARAGRGKPGPIGPVVMTCGTVEENRANNESLAAALREQGSLLTFAANRDAHTWTGWRDALDPHLTSLLRRVWH